MTTTHGRPAWVAHYLEPIERGFAQASADGWVYFEVVPPERARFRELAHVETVRLRRDGCGYLVEAIGAQARRIA